MLKKIRNNTFSRFLWGFMGIYLLNISVDTSDPTPNHVPENLSFNDQESILEILIEKVLGFEDAFKEYDDNDAEDYNSNTLLKVTFIAQKNNEKVLKNIFFQILKPSFSDKNSFINFGFHQIDTPPPKV